MLVSLACCACVHIFLIVLCPPLNFEQWQVGANTGVNMDHKVSLLPSCFFPFASVPCLAMALHSPWLLPAPQMFSVAGMSGAHCEARWLGHSQIFPTV